MKGKLSNESSVTVSQVMQHQDSDPLGMVYGGAIMRCIDNAASVVATRHARGQIVMAGIDQLNFFHPVYVGNLLTLKARLNYVGRSSMEIGVRVEAENLITGHVNHVTSAYLTFVALNAAGQPREVPPLILLTDDEIRRHAEAEERRKHRLAVRKMEMERRMDWIDSQAGKG